MSAAPRHGQRGVVLFSLAGGMLVVSGALASGYYVVATRGEARAATHVPGESNGERAIPSTSGSGATLDVFASRTVTVKTGSGSTKRTWAELGIELDPDEVMRVGKVGTEPELAALAAKGSIPVRLDRDKAVQALLQLKSQHDRAPVNAYLDLEQRTIQDDSAGRGIDVWASLPRIAAAARQGAEAVELVAVDVPARVTREGLGIDDISNVLGHYTTKFAVADRDRNHNLKLAASKINGYVLKPGEQWSFNETVGERSQATGYKIAHVITAGEMVDGLAGGTCQISTTLFGAAFFAGLDIVKTLNHSRPSTYTPLGFDATVVWNLTDLVIKNPYEFPVALHYRVSNGEAKVEVLGKPRPWTRVEFEREVLEESPYSTEERLDPEMPMGTTRLDQLGFPGYKIRRYRRFYQGKKMVKEQKWTLNYKPVTEYVRRGTNPDPDAPVVKHKDPKGPQIPKSKEFKMSQ
jgi:vancomycin resistance protein YoaR